MGIMAANVQVGVFSLENNGFLVPNIRVRSLSSKLASRFVVNVRTANGARVSSKRVPNYKIVNALPNNEADNQSICRGLLEKEFKFEPTFDEFLKAMESVSVDRERNQRRYMDSQRDDNLGQGDCDPHWVKNASSWAIGRGERKAKSSISDKKKLNTVKMPAKDVEEANCRNRAMNNSNLSFRETDRGLEDDRILGLYKKKYGNREEKNIELERRNTVVNSKYSQVQKETQIKRRWIDVRISSVDKKMSESRIKKSIDNVRVRDRNRNCDVVEENKKFEYSGKVEMGSPGISTEMQKKQLQQQKTWQRRMVDIVEGKMDKSDAKGVAGSQNSGGSNFASNAHDSEIHKSCKENFHEVDSQRMATKSETRNGTFRSDKWFKSQAEDKTVKLKFNKKRTECESPHERWDEKKLEHTPEHEIGINHETEGNSKEHNTYANGFKNAFFDKYRSKTYVRLHEGSADVDKPDSRGREAPTKFSGNSVNEKKVVGYENDNDFGMERKAFETFEVFTDVRGRPRVSRMEMEERIQKLAKWLNGTDVNLPAWQFSKMMHSAKIRFTDHSILRVIQILGYLGNWRRVLQVVQWLQSRERFRSYKSKYIYTTVLNVLGKLKRPVEALNVFYAMRQEFSSFPDLAAYHCIAVILGQAGLMKELFDVIDFMRALPQKKLKTGMLEKWDPRLEPDEVVYNAVLNACVQQKQWEGAFWVLQQLKHQHTRPSSTTYGLVMEVMFSCDKYNLVHEFFRKVERTSIPNALNYKILVNTLWREGKTDEAVLAVQDMERRGIVGTASLYYDLARCLCSAGRCQEGLQQINKICKVAKKPLVVTFTGLMQACLESGSVEDGAYIFKQMHEFCSPNIVTCNILLKAYVENNMFVEAKDLFQKILDSTDHIKSASDYNGKLIPDKFTFNTMLEACVEEKMWDDFEETFQRMLRHGYHFNPKRHLWMILEASRAGREQPLDIIWHHLVQAGRSVPLALIKERFCMKLQEDDIAAALSYLSNGQKRGLHGYSGKEWLDFMNRNIHRFQKDTVVRLVDELNVLISSCDQPNSTHLKLLYSCIVLSTSPVTEAATGSSVNG